LLTRIALLVAGLLVLVGSLGCPKQAATDSGAAEAAPSQKSRFSGSTGEFVRALLAAGIAGYDVAGAGASVVYEAVDLTEAGGFKAATTLRLGGGEEPFACVESGTWALDDGESQSATVAMVTFNLESTDCPGRTAPKSWRAKLEISGSDVLVTPF
jgi:hypothetical protein